MFTAVLQQINCHAEYKAGYLRRQVAWYLAKHAHIFAAMAPLQNDDTFESYVWDIFKGYRCGNECVLAAISKMWNLSISLIGPEMDAQKKICHTKTIPDMLLIRNKPDGDDVLYTATGMN